MRRVFAFKNQLYSHFIEKLIRDLIFDINSARFRHWSTNCSTLLMFHLHCSCFIALLCKSQTANAVQIHCKSIKKHSLLTVCSIPIYTYMCIFAYIYTYIHVNICIYMYICCIYTYVYICVYMYICICMHLYIYIYVYICMYIYIYVTFVWPNLYSIRCIAWLYI